MDDVKKITFKITGMADKTVNGTKVITLLNDKKRFDIWEKKKDGSNTKAWEQFQQHRFISGDEVTVSYSESESGMNPHTGNPYINRRVLFFDTDGQGTPVANQSYKPGYDDIPTIRLSEDQEPAPQSSSQDIKDILKKLEEINNDIRGLNDRITTLEKVDTVEINEIPF
jgi:hypothetical protein